MPYSAASFYTSDQEVMNEVMLALWAGVREIVGGDGWACSVKGKGGSRASSRDSDWKDRSLSGTGRTVERHSM